MTTKKPTKTKRPATSLLPSAASLKLATARKKIDQIDDKILALLVKRAKAALKVLDAKKRQAMPLRNIKRESAVLKRLARQETLPLKRQSITRIFKAIMAENLELQVLYSKKD